MRMLFVRFVKTWPAVDMQKGLQVFFEDTMIDIPIATYTHTRVIIKGKDNKYISDWLLYTILTINRNRVFACCDNFSTTIFSIPSICIHNIIWFQTQMLLITIACRYVNFENSKYSFIFFYFIISYYKWKLLNVFQR